MTITPPSKLGIYLTQRRWKDDSKTFYLIPNVPPKFSYVERYVHFKLTQN